MADLSFSKIKKFADRHKFSIMSLYGDAEDKNIRFIKFSTPGKFKRFFIAIPEKYNLRPPGGDVVGIEKDDLICDRATEYMTKILSDDDFKDVDLIMITKNELVYLNSKLGCDSIKTFSIVEYEEEEEEIVPDIINPVDNLLSQIKGMDLENIESFSPNEDPFNINDESSNTPISNNSIPNNTVPNNTSVPNNDASDCLNSQNNEDPMLLGDEGLTENKDELVLFSEPEVSNTENNENTEGIDDENNNENNDEEDSDDIDFVSYSDYDFEDIEVEYSDDEMEVEIGTIYPCINLMVFFKNVEQFEKAICEIYKKIEKSELEYKKEQLSTIKEKCFELGEYSEAKILESIKVDRYLTLNVDKLLLGLSKVDESNRELRSNIQKMISQLTKERERGKEEIDEYLCNVLFMLEELLEM